MYTTFKKFTQDTVAPQSPNFGDEWYNPTNTTLYKYIFYNNSPQWLAMPSFGSMSTPSWSAQSRPTNPVAGQIGYNTDKLKFEIYDSTAWVSFSPSQPPPSISYVVVGGGGGGGSNWGGGGGAGGFLTSTQSISAGVSYTVTVGTGGTGGTGAGGAGTAGNSSVFASVTALGGGFGSYSADPNAVPVRNGATAGSGASGGGGGARLNSTITNGSGGTGTAGQGNNGGSTSVTNPVPPNAGGSGGGGAGAVGGSSNQTSPTVGAGGTGRANPILGSITGQLSGGVYYLAGGGGGGSSGLGAGAGGLGGGGAGDGASGSGIAGTANTGGGGGGGGGNSGSGGAGGAGVVIIAYSSEFADLVTIGAGFLYTKTTAGLNTIYTFTSGTGTISW